MSGVSLDAGAGNQAVTAHRPPRRADIYERVTAHIVAELENGVRPWMKPWNAEHAAGRITRPLRHSGQPYRGINILMLWTAAELKGYACPIWLTFRQARELGACVKKGEHGSPVVYANRFTRSGVDDDGEEVEQDIYFLKEYTVFNAEQVEGLPAHFYALTEPPTDKPQRIERADRFFIATGAAIREGGNRAYYSPAGDYIQMPPLVSFRDAESHAATLAHELTHWTKHPTRLDRDLGRKHWGDEGYAAEELVAELGAAFLCADLRITPDVREDHAAYIANWLKVLKDDPRAIFRAAALAQKAIDFLHGLQPMGGDS